MSVLPAVDNPIDVAIACWPWGRYLAADTVDAKTSNYIRIHPDSTVADAKICGHYVNSILAGLALRGTKYHEALLLDADGYVSEGSADNIFIIKNGTLITPPKGTILVGITRNAVIDIARKMGIEVLEKKIRPNEIYEADEAFFTGTAVEVTPIRSLDDKIIGNGEPGPITRKIRESYLQIVHGKHSCSDEALTWVNTQKEACYE